MTGLEWARRPQQSTWKRAWKRVGPMLGLSAVGYDIDSQADGLAEAGDGSQSREYPAVARLEGPMRHLLRCAAAALCASALAGCGMSGMTSGFLGQTSSTGSATVNEASLLNAAKNEGGSPQLVNLEEVARDCPVFATPPGEREVTFYEPGREGEALGIVHRGEITQTARECRIDAGRLTIKYGFSGRVLLGPRGQPGTLSLPVAVKVQNGLKETVLTDRLEVQTAVDQTRPMGHFSAVRTVTVDLPEGSRPADFNVVVTFEKPKV